MRDVWLEWSALVGIVGEEMCSVGRSIVVATLLYARHRSEGEWSAVPHDMTTRGERGERLCPQGAFVMTSCLRPADPPVIHRGYSPFWMRNIALVLYLAKEP